MTGERHIVHDLANLFTCILLCASHEGDPADRDRDLEAIRYAAERGRELLRAVGAVQRLATAKECRVAQAVEACGRLIERVGARRGVAVTVEVVGDAQVALAEVELHEVVVNLALNAIEAMAAGGNLFIGAAVREREVQVTVIDDGPGMPEQPATRDGHSGLGLAGVREIVEGCGGRVEITSGTSGTSVLLWMPLAS